MKKEFRPWPVRKKLHAHMKMRQTQHRSKGMTLAEKWANEYLIKTGIKWKRQRIWGFRLFDFWNTNLGLAVEIDGPEHNEIRDIIEDRFEWERSRIIVKRIRNFNENDMLKFLTELPQIETWNERRLKNGLKKIN